MVAGRMEGWRAVFGSEIENENESGINPLCPDMIREADIDSDVDDISTSTVKSAELKLENVEKMMAKEIDRLTLQDRNAIYEEIHGVSTMAIEETPELLEESLWSFEDELNKIDPESRFAYDCVANANQTPPSANTNSDNNTTSNGSGSGYSSSSSSQPRIIATDRAFRLRFLRCVFFDPRLAANRMVNFFELLYALYGQDALQNFDATMDFFVGERDVQAAFRSGYLQLLPFRDRSGRKIVVLVLDALEMDDKTRLKIYLYLTYVAGEDEETQRKGIVMLFWPGCNELRLPKPGYLNLVALALRGMPTRFASFHFCSPATPFFQMARVMISIALKRGKSVTRVKIHTGERMELQYELMGYGIPVNLIPTTGTGTLKTKVFGQWVKSRKLLEAFDKKGDPEISVKMGCPGVCDVIFRSAGKSCMLNPGNVAFRGTFEQYHSEHMRAGQTEKRNLVWKIVEEIEKKDGRFLVWDKRGWWTPLTDRAEIRNKVAISLRGYNKQRKADDNRQYFKSSTTAFEGQDGKKRAKRMLSDDESDDYCPMPCESC